MSQENVAIVRQSADALYRRDFDAALKDVAPDCEVDASSNLGEWRGVHQGHEQIRQLWRSFFERFETSRAHGLGKRFAPALYAAMRTLLGF